MDNQEIAHGPAPQVAVGFFNMWRIQVTTRQRKSDLDTVTPPVLLLQVTNSSESHVAQDSGLIQTLHYSQLDLRSVSLGLLTTSRSEYESYINLTASEPYKSVSIVLHPGHVDTLFDPQAVEAHRISADPLTTATPLSTLRNYLMFMTLQSEPHVIWLDAAITPEISTGLLPRILRKPTKPDVGLITYVDSKDVEDDSSSPWRLDAQKEENGRVIDALAEGLVTDTLVEVNSTDEMRQSEAVYIRADLVRHGLTFATGDNGSAGIETHGLYETVKLLGYKTYRMSPLG